ncbi:MAG: riboflavin synthase [Pseudomonadota bacterium]
MFTGLIEGMGKVASVERNGAGGRLRLSALFELGVPVLGESIAVSGVCLTAVECSPNAFLADVSPETLRRSTMGGLAVGARVNLERSVQVGARLGGHIVTGHVDSIARVVSRVEEGGAIVFRFSAPPESMALLVPKGSVALDGISLTVNDVEENEFTVSIIPHTAQVTTIGERRPGDAINIECDIVGKYVSRLAGAYLKQSGGVTKDLLARHGFLAGC